MCSIANVCVIAAGPSAPPSGVTADGMSTSITVQWGTVPCADQNGPITGYSVRYGEMGSGSTRNESATGNEEVISGLKTSTNYTVEVAAETSVGRGDYSEPIIVTTDSKISCQTLQHTLSSSLDSFEKSSYVLGSEAWEEYSSWLLGLIKDFVLSVWVGYMANTLTFTSLILRMTLGI